MRTIFTLVTLLFIIIAPYWLYLPLIFVGIVLFPLYLEAVAEALLVDILYGGAGHRFAPFLMPFTIISAILVLFAIPLREHIRFKH